MNTENTERNNNAVTDKGIDSADVELVDIDPYVRMINSWTAAAHIHAPWSRVARPVIVARIRKRSIN